MVRIEGKYAIVDFGITTPAYQEWVQPGQMTRRILVDELVTASRPGVKAKFEDGGTRGAQALAFIKSKIAAGRTVAITTATRSTQITPKTYAKWEESGTPLFKLTSGGDLKMYEGGSYVFVTQGTTPLAKISSFARPSVKAKMGRAEEIYQELQKIPANYSNSTRIDQLLVAALGLDDITPAGKKLSLHDLAMDVGKKTEVYRSRARTSYSAAKAKA